MALKKNLPLRIPLSTLPDVELSKRPNKILYGDDVLIDLTTDTVDESKVLTGYTFHKPNGTLGIGQYVPIEPIDLSVSTVTPETILEGYKAYNSDGELITGTYTPPIPRYLVLDYIQSSGTQYIKTGYALSKTGIVAEIEFQETGTTGDKSVMGYYISSTYIQRCGGNSWFGFTSVPSYSYGTRVVATSSKNSGTSSSFSYYIFAKQRYSDGGADTFATAKVFYAKLWDNDVLVRDYVPVKRIDDAAIGLYDKVNDKFYSNNGSGTFTAGSIIGMIY